MKWLKSATTTTKNFQPRSDLSQSICSMLCHDNLGQISGSLYVPCCVMTWLHYGMPHWLLNLVGKGGGERRALQHSHHRDGTFVPSQENIFFHHLHSYRCMPFSGLIQPEYLRVDLKKLKCSLSENL